MPLSGDLLRLADAVLFPGFAGHEPPDWLRRRLGEGLAGVALFSRNIAGPAQVARLTAALRAENPSVLVGVDEESGEVTRLEAATGSSRPGAYALGVADDVAMTEALAAELGADLARSGITIDFAPSADVNSNPDNPVIGLRSFGADPALVSRHAGAFVRGLQSAGVAACVKHFPGHGDTAVDSHHGVPEVAADGFKDGLLPFADAVREGVKAVMTGHLLVPSYDGELPATLSPKVLTGLLRGELGFQGVIVTDAIEMAAVAGAYGIGGAAARAIAAGADAICVGGEHADEATATGIRDAIAAAVTQGLLPEERLADAARRVRELAAWTASSGSAAATGSQGRAGSGALAGAGGDGGAGMVAARRAVRVVRRSTTPELPLAGAPHVVELAPEMNLAIDRHTPWGVGEPLTRLLPGTVVTRLGSGEATGPALERLIGAASGRPLVVVVRDVHRHPWQEEALRHLLSARRDTVVVEMGLPARSDLGAVHIATHGSARVCGQAAAEVLAGSL
ncbi:glycoside hydrolase family 3 protein [Nonomuraea sp. KC401]|uniref:glycoside hydrolase family 3 protein n=1 Tax=unclassified Nonomuraea TaxID=2593643 RepID=UPI0010FF070C|nr:MULTISPECIES: glycoside hydrolase family 3 N-terminal domain-containing protein [unclassified Nonomuraea]NBE97490.1 glycoside hydrolase family 3 protein [Nonomuraea sp. K271]TLF62741.1 glycoside hydrolase family 3 protein [Nonomuraea sp. KC401]